MRSHSFFALLTAKTGGGKRYPRSRVPRLLQDSHALPQLRRQGAFPLRGDLTHYVVLMMFRVHLIHH